jgi:BirA family transcriptional regulator, biotin operon repressor / biotin---[acetyl-CoA-carboxylase] ligase
VTLGHPRVHYRLIGSTNARARELAAAGAPHGTVITASEQSAGRGRQGRTWVAPAGRALLVSVVLRDPPRLLPLATGVAVAEVVGPGARIKWPNDVLLEGRKVAGILVEGRPQEHWAVAGIGVNVAVQESDFPDELRATAGTLGLDGDELEPTLARMLAALARWVGADSGKVLEAVRERDSLRGRHVRWNGGEGVAAGVDGDGRLVIETSEGRVFLEAGEVHLQKER